MSERPSQLAFGVAGIGVRRAVGLAALAVIASWPFGFAAADAYKCIENGRTTYQDQPCRRAGSVINTGNDAAGGRSSTAAADELSRLRARVAELEQARRAREIASEIEDREREIQGYDRAEQDERAALRAKQSYANYNLNGAVWERAWVEQGVAQEIQSVTEKYAARKQAARDRIAELRKDVDKSETERRAQ